MFISTFELEILVSGKGVQPTINSKPHSKVNNDIKKPYSLLKKKPAMFNILTVNPSYKYVHTVNKNLD